MDIKDTSELDIQIQYLDAIEKALSKEVENDLQEYEKLNDNLVRKNISIMKNLAKTYGELDMVLKRVKRQLNYTLTNRAEIQWLNYLLSRMEESLEEEKNDLPITNLIKKEGDFK